MAGNFRETGWFRLISNKYVWALLFFVVWMLFLDTYSWIDHRELDAQIDELEQNREYYKEEIRKDQDNIKLLSNPDQVEKYAREKYYMKRDSEDIYIIEFEEDSLEN